MIDTHAHLDALDDPRRSLARARAAGVDADLTVGTDRALLREGARARRTARGRLRVARHPSARGGESDADARRARELLGHPKAVAVGETGLDYYRDYAPHDAQRRSSRRSSSSPPSSASRSSSTPARPTTDTLAAAARLRRHRRPPLLLVAGALPERARARLVRLVRGQRHLPEGGRAARAATRGPAERILAETDCPYLAPQPRRGRPNEPAYVVHTLAALAEARGEEPDELARADRRERGRGFGLP